LSEQDATSTAAVGKFFDGYAADFDAIYGHTNQRGPLGRWIDRRFRQVMVDRFEEVLKHVRQHQIGSIVDIGCGPGRYVASFAEVGVRVTGIDLADGMIDLAREVVGGRDGVELLVGDYLVTEFEESFDAACLMGFFDYIEDPGAVIEKLKQDVTKEFYGSFPKSRDPLAFQRRVRYRLRGCPLYMYEREDVERLMDDCGIGEYEIKDLGRDLFVRGSLAT
jgi:SAM-dependent methyltransferase